MIATMGRVRHFAVTTLAALALVAGAIAVFPAPARAATTPCGAGSNPVACENSKAGTPESVWDIDGTGDSTIQGFSTNISVNLGQTESFKISTNARAYKIDIYRLGYYQGNGARLIASINPSASLPQTQPACISDPVTFDFDCGDWGVSASWTVPTTVVSGVYIALLTRTDTGGQSQIPFIVRDDSSHSDVVYQTSDPTWEAYNLYGGSDFYAGGDANGRAYKLSYNRPFATRGSTNGRDYLFSNEYPAIRFMEENGYDVTYISGVDTDRYGATLLTNHKAFMSVGHDEYWSVAQRANVTAARDAGVSLAFFSGNEVYWRTRYENSIDGSNTPYRTLVSYKETWADKPIDPQEPAADTATWRDPRFGQPAQPENGLTGTLFMSNSANFAIQVPSTYSKDRLWRNTSVANLASGQTATLEANSLGYEFDSDLDNGARPAGLIDLSSTTQQVSQKLVDYGNTVAQGIVTHNLTLYRAHSGALVFGAGTIQWAWGLDADHDGSDGTVSVPMQQATINLFADMGVAPQTLMSGMVAATKSTDATAPAPVLSAPTASSVVTVATPFTVSGTAADLGGGQVAGVEVSVNGGATWHPATGTTSWSYSWVPTVSGPTTVEVRATDDSANTSAPVTRAITVAQRACPCSIWPASALPAPNNVGGMSAGEGDGGASNGNDPSAVEVGVKFTSSVNGFVTGVRFYKASANTGTHTGSLWSSTGQLLATATFSGESATGWQQVSFPTAVQVSAGATYIASYYAPKGHYSSDVNYFQTSGLTSDPLTALVNTTSNPNGVYHYGNGGVFPADTSGATNYWVDPVFTASSSGPSITATSPLSGATSVAATTTVTATFNQAVVPASAIITLGQPGLSITGTSSYNATTKTVSFTSTSTLSPGTTYTAIVNGTSSSTGQAMLPFSWTFTTSTTPTPCPCSLWPSASTPTSAPANDPSGVNVGVKFQPTANGSITGMRFYKGAGNTGTHIGSLWSSTGTLLASATFTGETATGWQSVTFSTAVAVTAGTTYVASYFAPTGDYTATSGYFSSNGPSAGALTTPTDAAAGGNGVYDYGSTSGFPKSSFGATNYWVDVVLAASTSGAPTVISTTPSSGQVGVAVSATASATFGQPVTSVVFGLSSSGGAVAGTTSYNSATNTATFTPSAVLAAGVTYTASVSATGQASGVAMATPVTWSFTTAAAGGGCPCSIWPAGVPGTASQSDSSAVELGVKFQSSTAGTITGVRFYKGAGNTGTHTGSLWSASGALLATATFSGESATGWQTVTFASPVSVTAGTTYIASYYTSVGHYAGDQNYFATAGTTNGSLTALSSPASAGGNGVYRYGTGGVAPTSTYLATNYWVDVLFVPSTSGPPSVTSTTPSSGQVGVAVSATASATFGQPVTSVVFGLSSSGGAVAGTTSYNSATNTATFTPSAVLAAGVTYTASVSATGQASGVAMATPVTWSFTTAAAGGGCPCSIWPAGVPGTASQSDSSAVELGVKFQSSTAGTITGVRFYKGAGNTGTHTGSLWSASGALLATATFSGESATGWQTVTFASPVSVTAGTTYIASYHTTVGHYAGDQNYFSTASTVNGPLTAFATTGVSGGNGVYHYGTGGVAPTDTYLATNYWVDVVFKS